MRYLFAIFIILTISVSLLSVGCGLLPTQTFMVKFSIPRKSNNQLIRLVYISLDSNAYKNIPAPIEGINPNGVRATYILFFEDGTFKAPISFDQTLYKLSTFYNHKKGESLYAPKEDWGRFEIGQDRIDFEVGMCEYIPGCRFKLKSGAFDIINDSTLRVDPVKKDNAYIFGKEAIKFHKIDSLDLSFINPAYAWHNKRDAKRK
jgi:hypothetical protein